MGQLPVRDVQRVHGAAGHRGAGGGLPGVRGRLRGGGTGVGASGLREVSTWTSSSSAADMTAHRVAAVPAGDERPGMAAMLEPQDDKTTDRSQVRRLRRTMSRPRHPIKELEAV